MKVRFDFEGSVLAITGGANGIGKALAVAATEAGARVVILDLDKGAIDDTVRQNPRISAMHLDVGDRDAVISAFSNIQRDHGRIDGLVCGAAIQPRTAVQGMDPAEWRRVLGINLDGVVWCYQAVIDSMIARRSGSIVAFTSGLATQGWPLASAYAASKAGLIAFVKSAAKEVAEHRVRFNLIAPGVIDTPQYRAANTGEDNERWRASTGIGQPEDVVGPLMFLLSDAATMTASVLSRDTAYSAKEP